MIRIREKTNEKMLQNFNNEQYPDLTIITKTTKIKLVLAYLSIDSGYFAELGVVEEIDLSGMPEKPLILILKALYGDQLIAYSIKQLTQMFGIIKQLRIEDFQMAIEAEILSKKELTDNLEVLEFCHENGVVWEQVKDHHLRNQLRTLENDRSFLQLNKVSEKTLVLCLMGLHEREGDQSHPIINNIMENYFNRNEISPVDFFENKEVEVLQIIWQKFHYTLQIFEKRTLSKNTLNESSFNSLKNLLDSIPCVSEQEQQQLLREKNKQILQLRQKLSKYDQQISQLRDRIYELKGITIKKKGGRKLLKPICTTDNNQTLNLQSIRYARKTIY